MYSLTFLSARQLVQDEEATCEILEYMPRILYNILFKVAFRANKTRVLFQLVKMWPYSELKFQMLLQTCRHCSWTSYKKCPECRYTFTYDEFSKSKIDAIMFGVISYIREVITGRSQQPTYRRLQQLDMTGLFGHRFLWNLRLLRLWANSIRRARDCIFSQHGTLDPQRLAWDQEAEESLITAFPREARVDLLIDYYVSPTSEEFLKAAFQGNANSPLHLICRDFYNPYLSVPYAVRFLPLLEPLELRRMDLICSNLTLIDVRWFMSKITIFLNLKSLKMPYFREKKQWWKDRRRKANFDFFTAELNTLRQLRELALHGICLSGRLEYLLRDLECSLESLQLSSCSLKRKDLQYLAQSHHSAHLIKVDFTDNNIADELDSFQEFLKSVSNTLMWLNLTMCGIKDFDFYQILPYLYSCTKLSHLGLYGNPLSSISILPFLRQCQQKLPKLKVISFPIFVDCCKNLPQIGPLPRELENYINSETFFPVLNEMSQLPLLRGESAIVYNFSRNFDRGDYFDLR